MKQSSKGAVTPVSGHNFKAVLVVEVAADAMAWIRPVLEFSKRHS